MRLVPALALMGRSQGLPAVALGIEEVAEAVAEEVEAEEGDGEEAGGEDQHPRVSLHPLSAFVEEDAPGAVWGLDAESEEAEDGLEENHGGDCERRVDDDRRKGVGENVSEENRAVAESERAGCVDKG